MPLIGVVSDDLTGATTTGVFLARSKAKTAVFFNEDAAKNSGDNVDFDAVLISTNSRPMPAKEARRRVQDATETLMDMGTKYFSKRIDTTLRGGVGVEIDAMMDVIGNDIIAIVVPSMPQSRRILVGGYSVIDNVALINTPVAKDVRTPVHENFIPKLIQDQTQRQVGSVMLGDILQGTEAIKKALLAQREAGCEIIVVDAISLEDVESIARACIELEWNVLSVDPGPLTTKLAYCRGLIDKEKANLPKKTTDGMGKTVLIAAGSATPVTKKQIEYLCKDSRHIQISVEPIPLINGGEDREEAVQDAISRAMEYLNNGSPRALVFETALHGSLINLDEEDEKRGYVGGTSADNINVGLGMIIKGILDQTAEDKKIAGLYCTGGDTMVNVCTTLGVECLEMVDYVIAQSDIGRLVGNYDGMPIIGKGGLTGFVYTACDIVDRVFKEASRNL